MRGPALSTLRPLVAAAAWALAGAIGSGQSLAPAAAPAAAPELVARGARFYIEGLDAGGASLPATVQDDLRVTSAGMPCVNCHRRSGWGTAEGPVTVPPVVGEALFAPVTQGAPEMGNVRTLRPPYTEADLLRALRDGVDPAGRALSPTMPRYAVREADARALGAYLQSLSAVAPGGVTDSTVHLATIVADGVSDAKRASLLDTLRAFVRVKNAGTRQETRRRERGPWNRSQDYDNHRDWVLHEWELRGPSSGWAAQLETLYRDEPVYAVVAGLAAEDWAPVHEFAERFRVPVVLPQTPLAPAGDSRDGFYSLYFSRGVALEAEALAHHLQRSAPARKALQVSRCGSVGEVAAARLAAAAGAAVAVRSTCLDPAVAMTEAVWRDLLSGADTVVAWLGPGDGAALDALAAPTGPATDGVTVFLSSSLLGEYAIQVSRKLRGRAALVHPLVPPDAFEAHTARALAWLRANGVAAADRQVAVNAMFAAVLAADALGLPRALESREYFVERIEHMTSRSPNPSAYPGLSFDFVRRFGSLGCYVLQAPASPDGTFKEVGPWFVPRQ